MTPFVYGNINVSFNQIYQATLFLILKFTSAFNSLLGYNNSDAFSENQIPEITACSEC